MNKYIKIFGLVLVGALIVVAQSSDVTYFTKLLVSSSPSTSTNTLTAGQMEVAGTFYALGTVSIDGDIDFVGPQEITTSSGDLTLNPAEGGDIVIATTDTLTAGPITSSLNYVLEGYSTGRSVLRIVDILITNAGDGGKLQLESTNVYNGDVNAAEDNLAIDVAGTNFIYGDGAGADDNKVRMLDAGISGVPIAVLSSVYLLNAGGSQHVVSGSVVSNNIELTFLGITDASTTADLDLLVDTGDFTIRVTYITTL